MESIWTRLREMSRERNKILYSLGASEDQRVENLIQIFLYRDTTTVHHWISELYASCRKMDRCKANHRYLDYKTVAQELWYSWSDCYYDRHDVYCDDVSRKEHLPIPEHNADNLYQFMGDYHLWLSKELSTRGIVNFNDVDSKVRDLLRKYPLK